MELTYNELTKKTIYTRSEVVKLYGTAMFEKSKDFVQWQKKGEGKTFLVICQRFDFENYIRKLNLSIKPVKENYKK